MMLPYVEAAETPPKYKMLPARKPLKGNYRWRTVVELWDDDADELVAQRGLTHSEAYVAKGPESYGYLIAAASAEIASKV